MTESLAAPLIESIRRDYEERLSQKDSDIAKREASLRDREETLTKAKASLDDQVAEKLREERTKIAAEETRKAKRALAIDIDQKDKEITDLQEVLKQRDAKLLEAQKAQGKLIRKQRELRGLGAGWGPGLAITHFMINKGKGSMNGFTQPLQLAGNGLQVIVQHGMVLNEFNFPQIS